MTWYDKFWPKRMLVVVRSTSTTVMRGGGMAFSLAARSRSQGLLGRSVAVGRYRGVPLTTRWGLPLICVFACWVVHRMVWKSLKISLIPWKMMNQPCFKNGVFLQSQGWSSVSPLTNGVLYIVTWWLIPLSKWVITPVINGISRVTPLKSLGWTNPLTKWDEPPSYTCDFNACARLWRVPYFSRCSPGARDLRPGVAEIWGLGAAAVPWICLISETENTGGWKISSERSGSLLTVSLDDLLIPLNSPQKMCFGELVKPKKKMQAIGPAQCTRSTMLKFHLLFLRCAGADWWGSFLANMTGKKHNLLNMGNVWKCHVISLDRRTENYQEGPSKAYFNLTNEV